jgi:hypothetical protein
MFLGMAADVTDVLRYGEQTEGTDVALAATMALAKNLQDKTYMQGVAAAVQAMEDPDRYLEGWLKRTASSFMPYTSLVGQIEKTGDPTIRVANTLLEKLQAKIPVLSESLPPRRNLWGDPIVLNGAWGWEMVSPIYQSLDVDDEVANEIVAQEVPVRKQITKISAGNGQIELTLEESDRLAVLTGKEIKWDGLNMHAFLKYEMNTPSYAAMTDGPDGEKALTIRGIINDFREEALDQLKDEYPDLVKRIEKAEDEKETLLGY